MLVVYNWDSEKALVLFDEFVLIGRSRGEEIKDEKYPSKQNTSKSF